MRSISKIVLIIDDNVVDRHTYNRYLEQDTIFNYQVIESETGEEGLNLLQSEYPDIILLDFNLPDMNGLEFIDELKIKYNFLPPIIMLTGVGNTFIAVEAMKLGVKDYLVKGKVNEENLCFAVRNVLEQVRLQHLADRNEKRFRVSINNILDCFGIYTSVRNEQNEIISFNPDYLNESACNANSLDRQQKIDLKICSSNIFNDFSDLFSLCCQVVKTEKAITIEYLVKGKSQEGENVHNFLEIRINKLEDGFVAVWRDITQRKKAEILLKQQKEQLIKINRDLKLTTSLLQKRNRELDEFTYIVSHDLKAPLRGINNLSEWIEEDLEDKLDEENKRHLTLLRGRVARMDKFIDSLLEYSRIGRQQISTETFAVKDLLLEILDFLAPPKTFTISIDEAMPTIRTQKIALEQVFSNLIGNAIKHHHTQSGKINISVSEDSKFYYFSVTDDGVGIDPKYQERIFRIFQTLSSRDDRENTGIGLSIVKKIVENQGGKIEIESQVNRGATFRFSWLKQR